jgi:hypothetical protein
MITMHRLLMPAATCWVLGLGLASSAGGGSGGTAAAPIDPEPCIVYQFGSDMRFGLAIRKDHQGKAVNKRLTYADHGDTNSTLVRIDGKDFFFGGGPGQWITKEAAVAADPVWEAPAGKASVWEIGKLRVTQVLHIVPSKQPVQDAKGGPKRLLDTLQW